VGAKKRQHSSPLKNHLSDDFFSFSFFKAVGLLDATRPVSDRLGRSLSPKKEAVRFHVKPGFSFPASDISGLEFRKDDPQAHMEVAFMGLIGPSGVLPHVINQLAEKRNKEKDYSLTAFLDLFHHRLISLFYLAWKKSKFPVNYLPDAQDRLSGYLRSFIGLGTPKLAERVGLPDESLLFYSGLLSRPVPSAAAISAAVQYFSGTTVNIDQFINRMIPLDTEDQTQIGSANSRLGQDTVCGKYVWECQSKFRVRLGPMGFKTFLRFQPSGDLLYPVGSFIRYMVGMEFEFELRIYLDHKEVPPTILGGGEGSSPRLGWTTWIKSPAFEHTEDPFIVFQETDILNKEN